MPLPRFALLLLATLSLGAASLSAQSTDPADEYFRAYLMNNEAERLMQAGEIQRAADKYQQALAIFDTIAKTNPTWQSQMLTFRRTKIADAIANAQAELQKPKAAPAPVAPAPAPVQPVQPGAATIMPVAPIPLAPVSTAQGLSSLPPPVASTGDPVQDAIENLRRATEAKTSVVQQQLNNALANVGRYQLGYEAAVGQRDEAVRQRDQYYTQATQLQQTTVAQQARMAELEKQAATSATAAAELAKLRQDFADTNELLTEAKERLTKAESSVMTQSKQLTEATMKLSAVQKERDDLVKQRDDLQKSKDAAVADRDKFAKERDAAQTKLLGLQAENDMLKKNGPVADNMKALVAQNDKLRKDLEEARKQVTTLQADVTRKDQEITTLKGQLTNIQGELAMLRKENAAFETQVAELTVELKKIKDVAADPKKAQEAQNPQLMAENQLLRGIISRQLRQQARQQEQKRLIIAEMKKTEDTSKELIDQVQQLGGDRFALTAEEQKLFTTPQLQEIMGAEGIKATLMAKSDKPAASTPKDDAEAKAKAQINALIDSGNNLLQEGKLAEAAKAYEDVLRADPKNATGLAGLAWARVQQDKLDDAEATLKKAITYNPNDSAAHYMLGVTFFRRERLNEAMTSFEKSLELNGKNARARHYLGVITSKMGLTARAEKEFKSAIAIDPGYGDADFNLAVLYATSDPPKWDEARKHYNDAVKKGVKADPNLEKLLNGAGAVSKR